MKNIIIAASFTSFFIALIAISAAQLGYYHLSLNPEMFGVFSTNPYRSWFLRFSDGRTMDANGKMRSVVIDREQGTMRLGYRWIPLYTHCDTQAFLKAHITQDRLTGYPPELLP